MSRSWTSSVDLHLDIDLEPGRGRRADLERALREAIHDGRLSPGAPVPSSRALAKDLGVARGTVVDVYQQLVAEGYLLTRPGAATVVAPTPRAAEPVAPLPAPAPTPRANLQPGYLDLGTSFPRKQWLRALRAVLNNAPNSAFDYGDPRGRPELREALAWYLGRARGVITSPEHIVICAGFTHGLTLLASVLRGAGARVLAMEDPCLPLHRDVAHRSGLTIAPVPVDGDGARVAELHTTGAAAVVVTPAHQYPTGVTMPPERRAALVDWAREHDAVVIEDDYDGEFRYERQPVGSVQGLAPDHIVYAGTVSKTLAPGIRLGWLVLPARLVEPVVEAHRAVAFTGPAVEQLALAELIASSDLDRHLRGLRATYLHRRDYVVTALERAVPHLRPVGVAAGLHLLYRLPEGGPDEDAVRAAAERRGVALAYLSPHAHAPVDGRDQGMVVGYSCPPVHGFAQAVDDLVAVMRDVHGAA